MDKEIQFKSLLESNQDRIYRICCCYIRDEDERCDVFQDVLLQIWKNLEKFSGKSAIGTWVYRITVNVCLGRLRIAQRETRLFDRNQVPENAPIAGEHSDCVERQWRQLYHCIQQLPDMDKTLVSMFLEELSTSEMAEVLGISEANVRVKLHRIRKNLKDLWEESDHEFE